MTVTRYYCDFAYLGGDRAVAGVAIAVAGTSILTVERDAARAAGDVPLHGLTLPGFANANRSMPRTSSRQR